MRKRRLAHIVHQHLINKTQRLRSTLSSVSLVRQSFSSIDTTTEQQHKTISGRVHHQENKLKKRIISSPDEPFLKLISNKNHVHFFFGLDEGSDDNESNTSLNPQIRTTHNEPYSDRSDALLSMAHILDTNKPWSKHNHHTGIV
jgi:predicted RND superfamily exporter protein